MYEIEIEGIDECLATLESLEKMIRNYEFMEYIAQKSKETLDRITAQNISGYKEDTGSYASNHQIEVNQDEIVLFNNTKADLSHLSEKTRVNYPDGFSIAKAVEYGTGIVGQESDASSKAIGWTYDVNNHGYKGWFYEKNGKIYWTKGMAGKLIYYKTKLEIEKNVEKWILEYIDNNLI